MTPLIEHRKALEIDAYSLAPRLRKADVEEVRAATGADPLDDLIHGVRMSQPAMTVYRTSDNLPIAMYGVVPSEPTSKVGIVWMLGSDEISRGPCSMQFLKRCRKVVTLLNETYPVLTNLIDARNTVHLRWIEWCGFDVEGVQWIGDYKFYRFRRLLEKAPKYV